MKNLQIGDNDLIGNRFNGHDLHLYLQARGIQSEHLVWLKRSTDRTTHEIAGRIPTRDTIRELASGLENELSTQAMLHPFSHQILCDRRFLKSDIVHLHLIHNGFFNIAHLPLMCRLKPTIWTLHDPWALTGHCVYPLDCQRWAAGCGDCPYPETNFAITADRTALNWQAKKTYFDISNFDIIVSSKWMEDLVMRSPLTSGKTVHRIPFGLDLKKFRPADRTKARTAFKIPEGNTVLCLRANKSVFKGFEHIKHCLNALRGRKKITLLAFDTRGLLEEFRNDFQVVELGWTFDEQTTLNAYNAADIFLMPSRAESFGMMAMEAMACAKPCVVMDGTALVEVVHATEGGGVVTPQGDSDAFTAAVIELVRRPGLAAQIGARALELARRHYSLDRYLNSIMAAYEDCIRRRVRDQRAEVVVAQLKRVQNVVLERQKVTPAKTPKQTRQPRPPVIRGLSPYEKEARTIHLLVRTEWRLLGLQGYSKVHLFGAGQHTAWLIRTIEGIRGPYIEMIWDDHATGNTEISGIPVRKPVRSDSQSQPIPIVMSTDTHQAIFRKRIKKFWPGSKVVDLYKGLWKGPYTKKEIANN